MWRVFRKKVNQTVDWSDELIRERSPVQLHDFVVYNSIFFEDPALIVKKKSELLQNEKLADSTFYPLFFDSNPKTLKLLDLLIAEIKPEFVVETGVANGTSTRTILSAFKNYNLNNSQLFSFDIDSRVATKEFMDNSQFNFVLVGDRNFHQGILQIDQIDIFYHDSDHSYVNQMLEYTLAWERIRTGGALVSDDVNWSNAFLDFCKKVGKAPYILADTEKFSGVLYK